MPSVLNLFNIQDATLSPEDRVTQNTPMSMPETRVSGKALTPQEAANVQRAAGQYKKDLINRFSERLRGMSQDKKQYMVDAISRAANDRAIKELQIKNPKYRPVFPFSQ